MEMPIRYKTNRFNILQEFVLILFVVTQIQSSCLFNLLLSLETPSPDPLNIAELVKEEKPLKAIDFCYHDENEMVTILDCISLCVMVVSYSSESVRGYQMLVSFFLWIAHTNKLNKISTLTKRFFSAFIQNCILYLQY